MLYGQLSQHPFVRTTFSFIPFGNTDLVTRNKFVYVARYLTFLLLLYFAKIMFLKSIKITKYTFYLQIYKSTKQGHQHKQENRKLALRTSLPKTILFWDSLIFVSVHIEMWRCAVPILMSINANTICYLMSFNRMLCGKFQRDLRFKTNILWIMTLICSSLKTII